jgi:hypothetical protein
VRRKDGRVNLLDLVPPPDPHAAPPTNPNAPPPRLWIDEFTIRAGEATVIDLARAQPLTLAFHPIAFTLRNFSTRSEGNAYSLAAKSQREETLEWKGTFGLAPLASEGSFAIGHVHATTIADVGADQVPFVLSSGDIRLNGTYKLTEQGETVGLEAKLQELAIDSLGIRPRGADADLVTVPHLAITDTTFDLLAQTVTVGHVVLDKPRVTAVRSKEGHLNLLDLVPAAPAAPAVPAATVAATPAAPVKPWAIAVPDIRVNAADLSLEDRTAAGFANFRVTPIDLSVADYATTGAKPLTVALTAVINETGHASVKGTLTPSPLSAHLTVAADSLPLASLQSYADAFTSIVFKSGTANATGTLALDASGAVQFEGTAGVDDLDTIDRQLEQDFLKWKSLKANGVRLKTAPFAVRVREIVLHEPYARLIIGANGITNIKEVLAPRAAAAQAAEIAAAQATKGAPAAEKADATEVTLPPQPPGPALPVEIGIVRIDGGSMNFADFSIKPNFDTGIQELKGTVRGLSGRADARADIDLAGSVDKYAPVTITGKVNYLAAVKHLDLAAKFSNLELTNLTPYSGRFAGYAIERGKMTMDLHYKVEGRTIDAQHRIVINQLQLGDKVDSPEATSLPVKLAIALLKDRNGVIELDLPVSGSLDDPKFKLGPLVWKVVVNLIEKAVTAPFALLGKLFGGGEEMSYIDFPAGVSAIDDANRTKLASLVKALDARPALNLDVPLAFQPDADRAALVTSRWHDSLVAGARVRLGAHANDPGAVDRLLATPKDYRAVLDDAYRAAFGKKADIPKPTPPPADAAAAAAADVAWLEDALKARITVSQDDLDQLAQDRANSVQAVLLTNTGIDPGRVFVIAAKPLPAAPAVRMQLALH